MQALLPDNLQDALSIFNYIIVPKSQYGKSVRTQTGISLLIVLHIFCVLSAVKFYDNPFVKRYKVNNICFNRLLPAKLDAFKLTVSQIPP